MLAKLSTAGASHRPPPLSSCDRHRPRQPLHQLPRQRSQSASAPPAGLPGLLGSKNPAGLGSTAMSSRSPAELFAVATEHFFEQPEGLERKHAVMYGLMAEFYRQDPVVRERVRAGRPWRARERLFRAGLPQLPRAGDGLRHLTRAAVEALGPLASSPRAMVAFLIALVVSALAQWHHWEHHPPSFGSQNPGVRAPR